MSNFIDEMAEGLNAAGLEVFKMDEDGVSKYVGDGEFKEGTEDLLRKAITAHTSEPGEIVGLDAARRNIDRLHSLLKGNTPQQGTPWYEISVAVDSFERMLRQLQVEREISLARARLIRVLDRQLGEAPCRHDRCNNGLKLRKRINRLEEGIAAAKIALNFSLCHVSLEGTRMDVKKAAQELQGLLES